VDEQHEDVDTELLNGEVSRESGFETGELDSGWACADGVTCKD
jgi:hypothetical protein